MKRTILLFSIVGGLSTLALSSYTGGFATSSTATTQNFTNVPGNVPGCGNGVGCHAPGLASSINVGVTVIDMENNTIVDSTFVPGHQYHVMVTGTSSDTANLDHFGFQCAVSTPIGTGGIIYPTGTFIPVSGVMDVGVAQGCGYIEQTVDLPKGSSSFNTYQTPMFEWDADTSTSLDSVYFYAIILPNQHIDANFANDSSNVAVPYGLKRGLFSEGIANVLNNASINTYPNPVGDNLNISLTKAIPGLYTVNVYDVSGRRILCQNYHVNSSTYTASVNTTKWTPGVYQVQLLCGPSRRTFSIVK